MPKLPMTAIALVALATIAACESNGHTRYASVGTIGPGGAGGATGGNGQNGGTGADGTDGQNGGPGIQGPAGPAGPSGPTGATGPSGPSGPTGPTGATGAQGEPGGNFAFGDAGLIATGGLVGPSGIGGTGLLANLGDPSTNIPVVSDVSASGGTIVTAAATGIDTLVGEANLPTELTTVTGAVTQTVANVGEALEAFGSDGAPLADGLTSAVSPVLTASLGGSTLAGDGDETSLIGLSILSSEQQSGALAEVGLASGSTLLNADLSPDSDTALVVGSLASVDLGPVTDGLNGLLEETGLSDVTGMLDLGTAESGVLADVTDTVSGLLTGEGDLNGLTAPLDGLLSGSGDLSDLTAPVEDLLSGSGLLSGLTDPAEDLLGDQGLLANLTDPVETLLSGDSDTSETPLEPVLSGVTGILGGLLGGGK